MVPQLPRHKHGATRAASTQDAPPPASSVALEPVLDSSDGFNLRVPTGPFASRSTSPLGPLLAGIGNDPTPEVDRNERACSRKSTAVTLIQGSTAATTESSPFKLRRTAPKPASPAAAC